MAQWKWEGSGISSGLYQVAVLSLLVSCVISLVRTFFFSVIYFVVVTYIAHEVSFKMIDLLVI
jgi:hypothetical protein